MRIANNEIMKFIVYAYAMNLKDQYITAYLKSFNLDLPGPEIQEFVSMFQEKKFNKGDHLVEAGTRSSFFAFITSGLVRFYFNTYEGKEFNQTFKKENHLIVDYFSALTNEPPLFSIQALEPTTTLSCDYKNIEALYDKHRNWERLGRLIIEHNFIIKSRREANLLMLDAKNRYLKFQEEFKDFFPRISQQDMALYIGVNPSTLNRIIKDQGK